MNKEKEETTSVDKDNVSIQKDKEMLGTTEDGPHDYENEKEQEEEKAKTFEEMEEENKVLSDKMMRALAETENIRKKFFKEKKDAEIYGRTKLARDLLSVLDNLNRALESVDDDLRSSQNAFLEGIELTRKELLNTFSNHEISELAPHIGDKFDPKFHQAMFEGPDPEIEKGNIIQIMAAGFTIGDRLLRAAQVGVSSGLVKKDDNSLT